MPLLVLIGAQAVGKMTVGRELEKELMVNYYLIIKLLIYLPIILGIRLRHLSCLIPLGSNFSKHLWLVNRIQLRQSYLLF